MALTRSHLPVRMNYTRRGVKHRVNTYSTVLLKENCLFMMAVEVKTVVEIRNPISI